MEEYKKNLFGGFVLIAFFILSYFFVNWGSGGSGVKPEDLKSLVTDAPKFDSNSSGAVDMVLGRPMDINTITIDELKLIPGVGYKTAKKIFEKRIELGGFKNLDELSQVDGLGVKKIKTIKKYVEVRVATSEPPGATDN